MLLLLLLLFVSLGLHSLLMSTIAFIAIDCETMQHCRPKKECAWFCISFVCRPFSVSKAEVGHNIRKENGPGFSFCSLCQRSRDDTACEKMICVDGCICLAFVLKIGTWIGLVLVKYVPLIRLRRAVFFSILFLKVAMTSGQINSRFSSILVHRYLHFMD